MSGPDQSPADVTILAPGPSYGSFSRRAFLGVTAAGVLSACAGKSSTSGASDTGVVNQAPSASATKAAQKLESKLNVYTWAEYTEPDNIKAFSKANSVHIKLDIYDSNEAMIAKLELAKGTSGYDLCVPTGTFIPQMVSKGLLEPMDTSKLKNFDKIDAKYRDQPWDRGNKHSVCKDFGTTGFMYDKTVVRNNPKAWGDFFTLAQQDGISGQVSLLDDPGEITGAYFWWKGIDPNKATSADYDKAKAYLVDTIAPHVKAFDAYPGGKAAQGDYVLSHVYSGDARAALATAKDFVWVIPTPHANLWMDTYAIVKGAKDLNAAYAFIDYLLEPRVSAREISYHGYNTGVDATKQFLPANLTHKEVVYPSAAEQSRLVPLLLTPLHPRSVEILNAMKAKAGK